MTTDMIVSNKSAIEKTERSQEKAIQLKKTLLGLINFDTQNLDSAKIIYFSKKDIRSPEAWFSVIMDGLKLLENYPKIPFNAKVTIASYSEDSQKYETTTHTLKFINGEDLAAHCFNTFWEINFSDIVRIDAVSSISFGRQYRISAVFIRNDSF